MSPEFAAMVMLVFTVLVGATVAITLRGPLGRALARRIEGKYADPDESVRMLDMEHRMAELETSQARVAELEERLDFAERLLARPAEAERIDAGRSRL